MYACKGILTFSTKWWAVGVWEKRGKLAWNNGKWREQNQENTVYSNSNRLKNNCEQPRYFEYSN